jgi:hypothetical protein
MTAAMLRRSHFFNKCLFGEQSVYLSKCQTAPKQFIIIKDLDILIDIPRTFEKFNTSRRPSSQ